MKRWLMWMTALALAGVLTACAGTAGQADTEHSQPVQGESQSERESPTPAPTVSEFLHGDGESGVLVAYFSATGNTRGVAQTLQGVLDADLYEITAAEPYTQDDLNYSNDGCRANQEQNDPDARPAMAGTLENPEDYDVVFLGYPIWWGQAPKIVYTFLERCDFGDADIIPFCTSGSSGIGGSLDDLQALAPQANWHAGRRLGAGATQDEIAQWVDGLELDLPQ